MPYPGVFLRGEVLNYLRFRNLLPRPRFLLVVVAHAAEDVLAVTSKVDGIGELRVLMVVVVVLWMLRASFV